MKNKVIPWILAATLVTSLTGCQLIPVEEELPVAPVVKTYQGVEHEQVAVRRGDLIATSVVQCKYQALEKEELSFRLGGEYIEGVYVQVGQEVHAGELLAELAHDNLNEQIKSQDYQLAVLNMQKRHLQDLKDLELARQDALIAELDAKIKAVQEQLDQRTQWEEGWKAYEEQLKQWEADMELWESQQTPPTDPETVPEETVPEETVPEETIPEETVPEPQKPQEPEQCPVEWTMEELNAELEKLERDRRNQVNSKSSVTNNYDQQIATVGDSLYVQQLRMDELKAQVEERRIYASIDGIVSYVQSNRAESETSGQEGIGQKSVKGERFVTVMNTDSMFFTVTGSGAERFPVGTETMIVYNRMEMRAISVEAPEGMETENVAYLQLVTPDPTLDDGITGTIELVDEHLVNVLYLPTKAIQQVDGATVVYVLNEDGLKVTQEVTIGVTINGNVEILKGLSEGDSVIVD